MSRSLAHRALVCLTLLGALTTGCSSDVGVGKIEGDVSVSPRFTDLGLQAVDTEVDTQIILTATKVDIKVLAVDVFNVEGDAFSLVTAPLPTIPGDGSEELIIRWMPDEPGRSWARVTITHQAGEDEIELRGEAGLPAARVLPPLIDFGRVPAGESATASITVENTGTMDLSIDEATFDNTTFASASPLPLVVEPGLSVDVSVVFNPTDDNAQTGLGTLNLGDWVTEGTVELRGNDCSAGGGGSFDQDGDGFSWCASDCDDTRDDVHPAAAEVCDGADNNCNGELDENTECSDDDGDGASEAEGDCNDDDSAVGPHTTEDYSNGIDDDCDGTVDHGQDDVDGDGYIEAAGDCNEGNADIHPGATELPNGLDDDCDGIVDEGTTAYDDDGDGFTEVGGDCDDTDSGVYPGATETADWVDEDCDGFVDEGTTAYDDDGDGFTEVGGDCNDANPSVSPAAVEIPSNGIDDDCDTATPD